MRALDWWLDIASIHHFTSREGKHQGRASTSELRRWFKNKALHVNSMPLHDENQEMDFLIYSIILFPNSKKHKTTIW